MKSIDLQTVRSPLDTMGTNGIWKQFPSEMRIFFGVHLMLNCLSIDIPLLGILDYVSIYQRVLDDTSFFFLMDTPLFTKDILFDFIHCL